MSNTARDPADHPIDPPDEDDAAARDRRVLLDLIDELRADAAIVAANLKAENWRLIQKAERDKPPEVWKSIKAAIRAASVDVWVRQGAIFVPPAQKNEQARQRQRKSDEERVRRWCELGIIVAEKRGGRWFIRMDSLNTYLAGLRGK
jgi:hypothetical protein